MLIKLTAILPQMNTIFAYLYISQYFIIHIPPRTSKNFILFITSIKESTTDTNQWKMTKKLSAIRINHVFMDWFE